MKINSLAFFDSLSIFNKLQNVNENATNGEIHLFAYLSCLLFLYSGQSVSEWGYQFAGTREGSPFSPDLAEAIFNLKLLGFLLEIENYIKLTDAGCEEYKLLLSLEQNTLREVYLKGACSSVLALPVGLVKNALLKEPELRRAVSLDSARVLLESPGVDLLKEQFSALKKAVGTNVEDLMIPTVVWLTFLSHLPLKDERNKGEAIS